MLQQALHEWERGECPIAVPRGTKRADSKWTVWQDRRPTLTTVKRMFGDEPVNLALVMGRANGNGLALDCDGPAEFGAMYQTLWNARALARVIRRTPNGTAHDGGGTFLLKTSLPVASSDIKLSDGLTIEGRAQGMYTMGPGSEHPGGGLYYDWFAAPDGTATLHLLRQGNGFVVDGIPQLQFNAADPPKARISRKGWRLLNGESAMLDRYPSRSEAAAALCASLYRSGFDYHTVERLFTEHDCAGRFAEMYATDPDKAHTWLRLTWDRVTTWVNEHESPAVTLARRLAQWADERAWTGRTGSTDKAIYQAHLDIVSRCGRLEYAASTRDLAELAGVGRMTAARATHRLVDDGLLVYSTESVASMAQRYAILNVLGDVQECANWDTLSPPSVMECPTTHTEHGVSTFAQDDAFRWTGLGKTGADVWHVLETQGRMTVSEIAEATGRHRTTVKRKLDILLELGMVEVNDAKEWTLRIDADLGIVAKELGTAGALAKQQRRHAMQRAAHARTLEQGRDHEIQGN